MFLIQGVMKDDTSIHDEETLHFFNIWDLLKKTFKANAENTFKYKNPSIKETRKINSQNL